MKPVLTEYRGGHVTRWFCDPPADNMPFRVTRQSWYWLFDPPVREIFAWEPTNIFPCNDYLLRLEELP